MNARAVAAWSATSLFIVLSTTNPVYKATVLAAALSALAAGAGLRRIRGLLFGVLVISGFAMLLNFVSAHLGTTVLFELPARIPAVGGPYTLEALAFGASGGITIAAAILAAAPFSLLLASHEIMGCPARGTLANRRGNRSISQPGSRCRDLVRAGDRGATAARVAAPRSAVVDGDRGPGRAHQRRRLDSACRVDGGARVRFRVKDGDHLDKSATV